MVKFGFRFPSITKRISARTSLKRYVRNNLGLKAPRGWGWLTNPRKAAYNRVYSRTTRGCLVVLLVWFTITVGVVVAAPALMRKIHTLSTAAVVTKCSLEKGSRGGSSDGERQGP